MKNKSQACPRKGEVIGEGKLRTSARFFQMGKTSFVHKVQSQMETPKDRENYQKEIEDIKNILQEKYAENPNIEPIVNL